MLLGFVSDAALLSGALAAIAATCAYVAKVAHSVNRWRKAEQQRNAAVDAVTADWQARGLTPAGAVAEANRIRNTVENHVSAIADNKRRIDGHDDRLDTLEDTSERTSAVLERLNDRFDDIDGLLHEVLEERRDSP